MRSIADINDKLRRGKATVLTLRELKARIAEVGVSQTTREVDAIATGTFEPMEGSGATINLGHTDPPIKLRRCWLDGVPAYAGGGAVDLHIGASQMVERDDTDGSGEGLPDRGGGHVIEDLIAGRSVHLRATGYGTDCYPRTAFETSITKDSINQFYLFNPRNLYQNFIVGINGGDRALHTYLGPLQPNFGNAVYACGGALSPLLNDPQLRTIGIGSRILLGGSIGYVAWEGTQHFPLQRRLPNGIPIGPAATVALIGDAKQMDARWVRGCYFRNYGPSLMLGVGVPLPLLDEAVTAACSIEDKDIVAPVMDFSIPRRVRPVFCLVSYAQLKSGRIKVDGRTVRTAPLSSLYLSEQVAIDLKQRMLAGDFLLSEPVAPLPDDRPFLSQDRWSNQVNLDT